MQDSLQQRALGEGEGAVADPVHVVEGNPLDLLAVKHEEVVLADQQRAFCDEDEPLLLVVPVVDPGTDTGSCENSSNWSHLTLSSSG